MYLMTGGGKGTTTIMFEVYKLYMNEYEVGTACAMSYILFLIIAFVLAIQFKLLPQSGGSSVFTRKERYAKRCMRELQHEETL
jgi:ABC-type sugar transport system permease subunit